MSCFGVSGAAIGARTLFLNCRFSVLHYAFKIQKCELRVASQTHFQITFQYSFAQLYSKVHSKSPSVWHLNLDSKLHIQIAFECRITDSTPELHFKIVFQITFQYSIPRSIRKRTSSRQSWWHFKSTLQMTLQAIQIASAI